MANSNVLGTYEFQFNFNAKDARKQILSISNDFKSQLQEMDTASSKMSVLNNLVGYLEKLDKALDQFKAEHKDDFKDMFAGLDDQLTGSLKSVLGMSMQDFGKLSGIKGRIDSAKDAKAKLPELREIAQDINSLFKVIGDKEFINIDEMFTGKGVKFEERIKILNGALDEFYASYQFVTNSIKDGFGAGGMSGINKMSEEVKAETQALRDETRALRAAQQQMLVVQSDLDGATNGNKSVQKKYKIDLTGDAQQQIDVITKLIGTFDGLRKNFVDTNGHFKTLDMSIAENRENLFSMIDAIIKLKNAWSQVDGNNDLEAILKGVGGIGNDGGNLLGSLSKRARGQAKTLIENYLGDNFANQIQQAIEQRMQRFVELVPKDGIGKPGYSYNELAKILQKYHEDNAAKQSLKEGSKEYEELDAQLEQVQTDLIQVHQLGDQAAESLREIFTAYELKEFGIDRLIAEVSQLLGVSEHMTDQLSGDALKGVGQHAVTATEYIHAMTNAIREMFDVLSKAPDIEYKALIGGTDIAIKVGQEKEVSAKTTAEAYLANIMQDTDVDVHSHQGKGADINAPDVRNALKRQSSGLTKISAIVGKDEIVTLDLAKVKAEDAEAAIKKLEETTKHVKSISVEEFNKIFTDINPEYADVAKRWDPSRFRDLATYIYEVKQSAEQSFSPIEKLKQLLNSLLSSDKKPIDFSKYDDLLKTLSKDNVSDIFNQIASAEGITEDNKPLQVNAEDLSTLSVDELVVDIQRQKDSLVEARKALQITYQEIEDIVEKYSKTRRTENTEGYDFFKKYFHASELEEIDQLFTDQAFGNMKMSDLVKNIASRFNVEKPLDTEDTIEQSAEAQAEAIGYAKKILTKAWQDYYKATQDAKRAGVKVEDGEVSEEMQRIQDSIYDMVDQWKVRLPNGKDASWHLTELYGYITDDEWTFDEVQQKISEVFDNENITLGIPLEEIKEQAKQLDAVSESLERVDETTGRSMSTDYTKRIQAIEEASAALDKQKISYEELTAAIKAYKDAYDIERETGSNESGPGATAYALKANIREKLKFDSANELIDTDHWGRLLEGRESVEEVAVQLKPHLDASNLRKEKSALIKEFKRYAQQLEDTGELNLRNDADFDIWEKVLDGINDGTLTTLDKCIAKFEELRTEMKATSQAIEQTGEATKAAQNATATSETEAAQKADAVKDAVNEQTEAFKTEGKTVDAVAGSEIAALESLKNAIDQVTEAIGLKTLAFVDEQDAVAAVVKSEVDSLSLLKNELLNIQNLVSNVFSGESMKIDAEMADGDTNNRGGNSIASLLQAISKTLDSIYGVFKGVTGVEADSKDSIKKKEPVVKDAIGGGALDDKDASVLSGILSALRDVSGYLSRFNYDEPEPKNPEDDYALNNTLLESNRILGDILSVVKSNSDDEGGLANNLSKLIVALTPAIKTLQDAANGIIQYQERIKTDTSLAQARITNNQTRNDLVAHALGAVDYRKMNGGDSKVTKMIPRKDGIVEVIGYVQTAANEWEQFALQVDEANKVSILAMDINGQAAQAAARTAKALKKEEENKPKYTNPDDVVARAKQHLKDAQKDGTETTVQFKDSGRYTVSAKKTIGNLSQEIFQTFDEDVKAMERTTVTVSDHIATALARTHKFIEENSAGLDGKLLQDYKAAHDVLTNTDWEGNNDLDGWNKQIELVQRLGNKMQELIEAKRKLNEQPNAVANDTRLKAYTSQVNDAFKATGIDINAPKTEEEKAIVAARDEALNKLLEIRKTQGDLVDLNSQEKQVVDVLVQSLRDKSDAYILAKKNEEAAKQAEIQAQKDAEAERKKIAAFTGEHSKEILDFGKYVTNTRASIELTDSLNDELIELEEKLLGLSDIEGLKAWRLELVAFKNSVNDLKKSDEFRLDIAGQKESLKTLKKDVEDAFNFIELDENYSDQKDIIDEYNALIGLIKQKITLGRGASQEELTDMRKRASALQANIELQKEQNALANLPAAKNDQAKNLKDFTDNLENSHLLTSDLSGRLNDMNDELNNITTPKQLDEWIVRFEKLQGDIDVFMQSLKQAGITGAINPLYNTFSFIENNVADIGNIDLLTKYLTELEKIDDYIGRDSLDKSDLEAWKQQIDLVQRLGKELSDLILKKQKLADQPGVALSAERLGKYQSDAKSMIKDSGVDLNKDEDDVVYKQIKEIYSKILDKTKELKDSKAVLTESQAEEIGRLMSSLETWTNRYAKRNQDTIARRSFDDDKLSQQDAFDKYKNSIAAMGNVSDETKNKLEQLEEELNTIGNQDGLNKWKESFEEFKTGISKGVLSEMSDLKRQANAQVRGLGFKDTDTDLDDDQKEIIALRKQLTAQVDEYVAKIRNGQDAEIAGINETKDALNEKIRLYKEAHNADEQKANKNVYAGELNTYKRDINKSLQNTGLDMFDDDLEGDAKKIHDLFWKMHGEIEAAKSATGEAKQAALNAARATKEALQEEINLYKQANNIFDNNKVNRDVAKAERGYNLTAYNAKAYGDSDVIAEKLQKYNDALRKLKDLQKKANSTEGMTSDETTKFDHLIKQCNEYARSINDVVQSSEELRKSQKAIDTKEIMPGTDVSSAPAIHSALEKYVNETYEARAATQAFNADTNTLVFTVKEADGTIRKYAASLNAAKTAITTKYEGNVTSTSFLGSIFGGFKDKTRELWTYAAARMGVDEIIQAVRTGIQYVREIDGALTELKKVTSGTKAEYDAFLESMANTGSKVGATVSDLTTMAAEWAKLGYTMQESATLAENTAILLNVSEFDDATKASEALISTMQAFQYTADESGHVVDILNEVGECIARR